VVAILLVTARIATCRLDVTVRVRADPDLRPSRRNGEAANARERFPVAQRSALRVGVREAAALASAPQAWLPFVDIAQAGGSGRTPRLCPQLDHLGSPGLGTLGSLGCGRHASQTMQFWCQGPAWSAIPEAWHDVVQFAAGRVAA
jgi:hypothetical protein